MTEAPPTVAWWNPFSWSKGQEYSDARDADTAAYYANKSPEVRNEVADNLARGRVDVAGTILDEFTPSALVNNLSESSTQAASGIRAFLAPILAFPFKIIPPIGWVIIVIVVFVWVGGPQWVRAYIAKKS